MFRFALIGCGRIAIRHAENIIRVGKLVAVCDIDEMKANSFAQTYNAQAFTSITELLQSGIEIDIVVICTPNGYHAEHSIKALMAGKHVLCEKPMCLKKSEALDIIEAEKKYNRKLFVVKSMRFNPLLQELKRLIANGDLGNIYSFQLNCFWNRPKEYYQNSWHGKRFPDGGTLFTQFSHYIDAMLWLFGSLENVTGFTTNAAHKDSMEFEDTGVASLLLNNGILGTLNWSVNTFQKNFEIGLTVIAERGIIAIGGEFLNQLKSLNLLTDFRNDASMKEINRRNNSHHDQVYDNLILSLENDDHKFTNTSDGMKTVETIETIYRSIYKIDC
ncbi:Gfo/Idh/MocA family oxidoreductase [Chitinophagaceae bacterium LB-8]|uniref:Gfo/Idh/MocA family oxidoreductase n=1 Tax=Paraflavisolibacter caeni TaxID=2982496 RepID=A0A9X3BHC6_9BACT|nr:Gfo/Idh/MocA family oxidoreductase [Paraflavisolibacter caeni]MCU7552174.1 Gfo/Idh/MocA family oxidoreductase [Paraflavisolibacter caeni]